MIFNVYWHLNILKEKILRFTNAGDIQKRKLRRHFMIHIKTSDQHRSSKLTDFFDRLRLSSKQNHFCAWIFHKVLSFSPQILCNPHNLNIFHNIPFSFYILYEKRSRKRIILSAFLCTFHKQHIRLHFFAIYNCNIDVYFPLFGIPYNRRGKNLVMVLFMRLYNRYTD